MMRVRTMMSVLTAVALVAGMTTALPAGIAGAAGAASATGAAPTAAGLPAGYQSLPTFLQDQVIADPEDEDGGGDSVEPIDTVWFPLNPQAARSIPFDFAEPQVLYTAGAFPVNGEWQSDDPMRYRQSEGLEVVAVVTADLDGTGPDDIVSLAFSPHEESAAAFRSPGAALLPAAGTEPDLPEAATWYIVVQLVNDAGVGPARAYVLNDEDQNPLYGTGAHLAVGLVTDGGFADIVVSHGDSRTVTTFINDGNGTFPGMMRTMVAGSDKPNRTMVLGDFDGAGLGAAIVSSSSNKVLFLAGNGNGTFRQLGGIDLNESGDEPGGVVNLAAIDLDNSGRPALVTTSVDGPPRLWRYLTDGSGDAQWTEVEDFQPKADNLVATAAWVGDFDGNGFKDLAFQQQSCPMPASCLVPYLSSGVDGDGEPTGFTQQQAGPAEPSDRPDHPLADVHVPMVSGETVDVTGDGVLDILIPGGMGGVGIAVGDKDAGSGKGTGTFSELRTVAGAGGWDPAGGWDTTGGFDTTWGTSLSVHSVAATHATGAATPDLVVGTWTREYIGFAPGQLALVPAIDGSPGYFAAAQASPLSEKPWGADGVATELIDWDVDGQDDIVFVETPESGDSVVHVMRGRDGGFGEAGQAVALGVACLPGAALIADIDADTHPDVACLGTHDGDTGLYLARGDAGETIAPTEFVGAVPGAASLDESDGALFAADMNDDDLVDIAFTHRIGDGGYTVGWARNTGDSFDAPAPLTTVESGGETAEEEYFPQQPVIADLDVDGYADIVAGVTTGEDADNPRLSVVIFTNTGADQEPAFPDDPQRVPLVGLFQDNTPRDFWVEALDLDKDGDLDLIASRFASAESAMQILLNNSGTFAPVGDISHGLARPGRVLADLTGDSVPDLVEPTTRRGVQFRAGIANVDGTPSGEFGPPVVSGVPAWSVPWVAVTDVDGNGTLDVLGRVSSVVEWSSDPEQPRTNNLLVLPTGAPAGGPGDGTDPDDGTGPDDGDATPADVQAVSVAWSPAAGEPAGDVSDPLTGVTSGTVTVTVANTGTKPLLAPWTDAVYLSRDGEISADDVLLAAIPRKATVDGNADVIDGEQELTTTHEVTVAPPASGEWTLLLRTDTRSQLRDDDRSDNTATGTLTFAPPELTVPTTDTPETTSYTAGDHGIVVRIPATTSPLLLTLSSEADPLGLAVRENLMPTATVADQRLTGPGAITLLPGAERYVWVTAPKGQQVTLTLDRTPLAIGQVRPPVVGNRGPVTLTVIGAGLGRVAKAWAIPSGGDEIPASSVIRNTNGTLSVTVDLTGASAASYSLRVADSDGASARVASLDAAFRVADLPRGSVRVSVDTPRSIRPRVANIVVTFSNDGLTDAVAPIIRIRTAGMLPVDGSPYPMGRFYVTPAIAGAPVGIVPAGASGRTLIPFSMGPGAPNGLTAAEFPDAGRGRGATVSELFGIDSVAPYSAAEDLGPLVDALPDDEFTEADRIAIMQALADRFGHTGGTFLAGIHELRTGLAASGALADAPSANFELLLRYALQDAITSLPGATLHGTLSNASGQPVPYALLRIETDQEFASCGGDDDPPWCDPTQPPTPPSSATSGDGTNLTARTDGQGRWSLRGLPDGTSVRIFADGYGPDPLPIGGAVDDRVTTPVADGIALTLPAAWPVVVGRVAQGDAGQPARRATVLIWPQDADPDPALWVRAVTDADGTYRFPGVTPGRYQLTASTADGRQVTGEVVVAGASGSVVEADELTLAAAPVIAQGRIVTADEEGTSLAGAQVKVYPRDRSAGVITASGADGRFTAVGVGTGPWLVRVALAGYGTTVIPVAEDLAAGSRLELGDIEMYDEVVVTGTVRDSAGDPVVGAEVSDEFGDIATTAGNGTFTLNGVARDAAMQLTVFKQGYVHETRTVNTSSGENLDIETVSLRAATELRIVVTDGSQPLASVPVTVSGPGYDSTALTNQDLSQWFDDLGDGAWFQVGDGSYTVTALGASTAVTVAGSDVSAPSGGAAIAACPAGGDHYAADVSCFTITLTRAQGTLTGTVSPSGVDGAPGLDGVPVWVVDGEGWAPILPEVTGGSGTFSVTGAGGVTADFWVADPYLGIRHATGMFPANGESSTVAWQPGYSVAIEVDLDLAATAVWGDGDEITEGDVGYVLPRMYLQPQGAADGSGGVPSEAGGDASMRLIPSGVAGDPVTWMSTGEDTGTLSVADVPSGDYRLTIVHDDSSTDITEFSVASADRQVTAQKQTHTTAEGTLNLADAEFAIAPTEDFPDGRVPVIVELISDAGAGIPRRYLTVTDLAGAWSQQVAEGNYTVNVYRSTDPDTPARTFAFPEAGPEPFRGRTAAFTVAGPATASTSPRTPAPSVAAPAVASTHALASALAPAAIPFVRADGPGGISSIPAYTGVVDKSYINSLPGSIDSNPMVEMAQQTDYPPDSGDPCVVIDTIALSDARIAAHRAEQARYELNQQISMIHDIYETRSYEAITRAVVIAGEFAQAYLTVASLAAKETVAGVQATAEAAKAGTLADSVKMSVKEAADTVFNKGTLEGVGTVMAEGNEIIQKGMEIVEAVKTGGKGSDGHLSMLEAADAIAAVGPKVMGLLADRVSKSNPALGGAMKLVGVVANVKNIVTGTIDAKGAYDNATQILDILAGNLELYKADYQKQLTIAQDAWREFKAVGFAVRVIEPCDEDEDEDEEDCTPEDEEDCKGGGSGGDDDDGDDGSGDDGDDDGGGDDPTGPPPGPEPTRGPDPTVEETSLDPNEIIGPFGIGADDHWVQPGASFGYEVTFENVGPGTDPEDWPDWFEEDMLKNVAAAWRVAVDLPLPEGADPDSVELGEMGFGVGDDAVNYRPDAGAQTFFEERPWRKTVEAQYGDGTEDLDLLLRASAWVDRTAAPGPTVRWVIELVDPDTLLPHANVNAGFLVPEPADPADEGAGQGFVQASFLLDHEARDGAAAIDEVVAKATITFDENPPIDTNEWLNKIDRTVPATTIAGASTVVVGGAVSVNPADSQSGPALVDVWRSVDGAAPELWRYRVPPGQVTVDGLPTQQIRLAARASDRVGNIEPIPDLGDTSGWFATTLVAAPTPPPGQPGSGTGSGGNAGGAPGTGVAPGATDRLAGNDRYATSAAVAQRFGSATAVILANGENAFGGADALAANYLAGRVSAPIVLTRASVLPTSSAAAIRQVLTGAGNVTIYVMGTAASVSEAVAQQAKSAAAAVSGGTVTVVRIGGKDRYETAALTATSRGPVANAISFSPGVPGQKTAILASGSVNADALAAGPLSFAWGIPVLLTGAGALVDAARSVIASQGITQLIVLGGVDRIPQSALDEARAAGVTSIKRIAGPNRFATAVELYRFVMTEATDGSGRHYGVGEDGTVYLANGLTGFPDALSAGPLAGKSQSILLTVPGGTIDVVTGFLGQQKGRLETVIGLGGPTTVSEGAVSAAARATR